MNDSTKPETPQAKRLSLPELDLPENWTPQDLLRALANAHLSIAQNLAYLRELAERDGHQENANAIAIRQIEKSHKELVDRVTRLEGEVRQT